MSRGNNLENYSGVELINKSNLELAKLARELEVQRLDEDDVRYDIFKMIYEMIFDNIKLRIKINKLSTRILSLASIKVDKSVTNYFRKKNQALFAFNELQTTKFRSKLLEAKNKILYNRQDVGAAQMMRDSISQSLNESFVSESIESRQESAQMLHDLASDDEEAAELNSFLKK